MQQLWLVFVLGAVLAWGAYGPALHKGRAAFLSPGATPSDRVSASLRSLLCVGVAYFLVGVLVPVATLWWQGRLSGFTTGGTVFSTLAGTLGALGAASIIWAFQHGGKPMLVMPLVFAGAPVVNALITTATHAGEGQKLNPLLFLGFAMAAVGAFLVLRYMPA